MASIYSSPSPTVRFGLWFATTVTIIVAVFAIILRGAGPGNGGGVAALLWQTVGLAILPGVAVGLLQTRFLPHASVSARLVWMAVTVASAAGGWCIVFGLFAILGRLQLLPIIGKDIAPAIFNGLLYGSAMGAIIGLSVGAAQWCLGRINLTPHSWIVASVISWGIGVAVPLAVFFAVLSQIRFSVF